MWVTVLTVRRGGKTAERGFLFGLGRFGLSGRGGDVR